MITARWLRRVAAAGVAVALSGCVASNPPTAASIPPIPSNEARVWFYRTFLSDDTPDMPAVAMNGGTVGYARPGGSFYRDVAPGEYLVTVASYGRDNYQSQYVYLFPGHEQFIAIQSLPSWEEFGRNTQRGTYYATVKPPQVAEAALSQTNFFAGN